MILKSAGTTLSVAGSTLLAVRVKNFISALSLVVRCHENTIQTMLSKTDPIMNFHGSDKRVDHAEKSGLWLIAFGFGLMAFGGIINIISIWI